MDVLLAGIAAMVITRFGTDGREETDTMNEQLDTEIDTFGLLDTIYRRKIENGWTVEEAADLCAWLAFPKPVDGEPREVTRMRGIRETCERHGMMDLVEAAERDARDARAEWDAVLVNASPVEVYA